MAKHNVLVGTTDYSALVLIRDDAGAPKTALVAANVDFAYARVETDNDVTTADTTPSDLALLTTAHTDNGMLLVSNTDHPGLYRIDFPDAVFADGAWSAVWSITGTGLDPTHIEFVLEQHDYAVKVWMNDKNTATATDRYIVVFNRDGVDVTSGVTSPTIQVIKQADGTDLVASGALTGRRLFR